VTKERDANLPKANYQLNTNLIGSSGFGGGKDTLLQKEIASLRSQ